MFLLGHSRVRQLPLVFLGARFASSGGVDPSIGIKKPVNDANKPVKVTRQEQIDRTNLASHGKLYYIDQKFDIFNDKVTKVVDLGFVPGNWSQFSKSRLCQVHQLLEEDFSKKCHILAVDLLFGTPALGTSSIQGNIYSKFTHQRIIHHFKEIAIRKQLLNSQEQVLMNEEENSYFVREQDQTFFDQLDDITTNLDNLNLQNQKTQLLAALQPHHYQPDLILSDLSAPFLQDQGFFNNTNTRPYIRTGSNEGLKEVIIDPLKTSIDLADAALLLSCSALKKGGAIVLRLSKVDHIDPELKLLYQRLARVFHNVDTWSNVDYPKVIQDPHLAQSSRFDEKIFVCTDKIEDIADKREVFKP